MSPATSALKTLVFLMTLTIGWSGRPGQAAASAPPKSADNTKGSASTPSRAPQAPSKANKPRKPIPGKLQSKAPHSDKASDPQPGHSQPGNPQPKWRPLFDGKTLNGWHVPKKRVGHGTGGKWQVEDGTITGTQDPPGNGGLLFSDELFGDFEVRLQIKPDWGIDSGFFVRSTPRGQAFQVTVDHYKGGYIGQVYGEGLGGFNTRTMGLVPTLDSNGKLTALKAVKRGLPEGAKLDHAITPEAWTKAWKVNQWNTLRVRVQGQLPTIKTWINDVPVLVFNAATYVHPRFDKKLVEKTAPRKGHIALQIHGGTQRWAKGAKCRWRKIEVRALEPVGGSKPGATR